MTELKQYDLLLRGGHVICPASGLDGVMDVAVSDGRIAAVRRDILPRSSMSRAGWCFPA
jgi:dihydroorotase